MFHVNEHLVKTHLCRDLGTECIANYNGGSNEVSFLLEET
jgi:hypothetical protein